MCNLKLCLVVGLAAVACSGESFRTTDDALAGTAGALPEAAGGSVAETGGSGAAGRGSPSTGGSTPGDGGTAGAAGSEPASGGQEAAGGAELGTGGLSPGDGGAPSSGGSEPASGGQDASGGAELGTGGLPAGAGGTVGSGGAELGTGGYQAVGGAELGTGGSPPEGPCGELCEPTGPDDGVTLTFDGLGRPTLRFGAAAACVELTTDELGFTIHSWSCQTFPSSRTLSLQGATVATCSGAELPVSPSPQQPALRAGGYCFEITAGTGAPAVQML